MSERVQIDVPVCCVLPVEGQELRLWIVQRGELLHDIAPHLAWIGTFALHDAYGKFWAAYVVTNLETGFSVSRGKWPHEAVASAKRRLAKITPDELASAIERHRPRDE